MKEFIKRKKLTFTCKRCGKISGIGSLGIDEGLPELCDKCSGIGGPLTPRCKCGRDVTGHTHQADPMGGVICQLCDHTLSRPKRFESFNEMMEAATNNTLVGKALRKYIEVDKGLVLHLINEGMDADWMERLVKLNRDQAGRQQ